MRNLLAALVLGSAPISAEPVTVAALGDSLTQGFGLPADQGLVPQLQAWLDGQGAEVTVINAGVSGDTTAGGLARIGWTLTEDVDALIVALGGNDALRGLDPALSKANLDGILTEAGDRPILLVGISAPGNYGPAYKEAFDGMYPDLAETHGTLLYPNILGVLESMEDRQAALQTFMQADQIHPNADGVALIVKDFGPKVIELIAETSN